MESASPGRFDGLFTGNWYSWPYLGINMVETKSAASGRRQENGAIMFTRILLAIDDSASREAAVSFATALARQGSASVRIVHVNEYLVGGRGFATETQAEAIQLLESAVNSVRAAGIPTEGALYLSSSFGVEARITNAAHNWSADVIVLGSRRRRRFNPFAGKGVRERVISQTTLPVLTAPAPLQVASGKFPELDELAAAPLADYPSISI
jgi:nucleotide-binding universal stress UspA family protein